RKIRAEKAFMAAPAVRGDGELLKQILMNLVINAVQAMPEGGEIAVSLGVEGAAKTPFIEVRDEGAGIAPELMEKIFDPFFSTKEKGTGLGLAIASKIMQAHGGYIRVSSEQGKGSTFGMCFSAMCPAGGADASRR
ncbi:MAG: ATP-binding protein, partial [Nitrospiraceae bacterium]|nr:ATP-binding protein [Nitrospiraceae bacterium]